jgi:hypothetical protein
VLLTIVMEGRIRWTDIVQAVASVLTTLCAVLGLILVVCGRS